jgi:hypothetical protein
MLQNIFSLWRALLFPPDLEPPYYSHIIYDVIKILTTSIFREKPLTFACGCQ